VWLSREVDSGLSLDEPGMGKAWRVDSATLWSSIYWFEYDMSFSDVIMNNYCAPVAVWFGFPHAAFRFFWCVTRWSSAPTKLTVRKSIHLGEWALFGMLGS
jgi:hypothetical protein